MPKKLLYVGGLAKKTTPEEFAQYFSYYGDLEADLKRDAVTGQSLCYGFLNFDNESSAKQALADAGVHILGNKALKVRPATPAEVAQEQQDIDEPIGYEDGEDAPVALPPWKRPNRQSDFEAPPATIATTQVVPPRKKARMGDLTETPKASKPVKQKSVDETISYEVPKQGKKNQVCRRLWVGNVPKSTRDSDLAAYFARFGILYDVFLCHDMLGSQKLWGFITFEEPASAAKCLAKEEHVLKGSILQLEEAKVDALTVTGFSARTTEDEAWHYFSTYGNIEEFYMEEEATPRSAFLKYAASHEAEAVLVSPHELDGKRLQVRQCRKDGAQQKKELYVGGLARKTDEASLEEYFNWYGKVQKVMLARDGGGTSRGWACIAFEDNVSIELALAEADGHVIDGHTVGVKLSQRQAQPQAKVMVQGLLPSTAEAKLSCYFSHFGAVNAVELQVDRFTQKSKGIGVVTFDAVSTVETVLSSSGHKIDGKVVQVLPFKARV